MRIVVDTNLLVSGLIAAGGPPRQLLEAARAGRFDMCTSETLLAELLDVLSRRKFAERLSRAGIAPEGIVGELRRLTRVVPTPATPPRMVPTDPDDDHVIAATADLIASGDKRDLLVMGACAGIPIVTAGEALARVDAANKS